MRTIISAIFVLMFFLGIALMVIPTRSLPENCQTISWPSLKTVSGANLHHPMGVAWGNGFLYVTDTEDGAVKKLRDDGSLVGDWRGFKRPVDVATAGDFVYVAEFLADRIIKLRTDGAFVTQWGRHGNGAGEFDAPSGLAVDRQGDVYVADFYNHRIQKFSAGGKFLLQWGGNGRWSGQFHYPTDIAVNRRDELLVADGFNHRIQKFTADGRYLAKRGGIGYGWGGKWPGWFRLAKAVDVDARGDVYVADAFNRRVQKFTEDGELKAIWHDTRSEMDEVGYPAGVAVDLQGQLYVTDFFKNRIWKVECR
jgi:DNA-binding beta-propeller fold protein YncE